MARSKNDKIEKTYRGLTWTTDESLSLQLGKCKGYVGGMKYHLKDYFGGNVTTEDIIDYVLDNKFRRSPMCEHPEFGCKSDRELSKKLGVHPTYVTSYRRVHKGISTEEIVKHINDTNIVHTYRGLSWKNNAQLSRALGFTNSYVTVFKRRHPDIHTDEEVIDYVLDRLIELRKKRKKRNKK